MSEVLDNTCAPGHNYGMAKSAPADTGRVAVNAVSRPAWLMI